MEKVALNNLQLDHLARTNPSLRCVFYGTVPCDRLPKTLPQEGPTAYIVNTDPHDKTGVHWIALGRQGQVRDPGQLRPAVGRVWNRRAAPRMVVPSFQVPYSQRQESTVPFQSELRRLRPDVPDRPSRRSGHERVLESF